MATQRSCSCCPICGSTCLLSWDGLLEQLQLFGDDFQAGVAGHPCDVPARAREARDEPGDSRIANANHDDGDRLGGVLGCRLSLRPRRYDDDVVPGRARRADHQYLCTRRSTGSPARTFARLSQRSTASTAAEFFSLGTTKVSGSPGLARFERERCTSRLSAAILRTPSPPPSSGIAERQDGRVARRSSGLSPSSARISTMSLACSGAAWAGSSAFSRAMPRMTSVIARWRL